MSQFSEKFAIDDKIKFAIKHTRLMFYYSPKMTGERAGFGVLLIMKAASMC